MGNIIKGYPQVSRSITNPNVNRDDALDKFAPFSFLTFIKNVEESLHRNTLQDFIQLILIDGAKYLLKDSW